MSDTREVFEAMQRARVEGKSDFHRVNAALLLATTEPAIKALEAHAPGSEMTALTGAVGAWIDALEEAVMGCITLSAMKSDVINALAGKALFRAYYQVRALRSARALDGADMRFNQLARQQGFDL